MIMYNAGGAACNAPLITQIPLLLPPPPLLPFSWYFSQGVSPFHDWRNISSQSGLFCFKATPDLHNLRMSPSLLTAAREGQEVTPPHHLPPPPLFLLIHSSDSSFSPASPASGGQASGRGVCVCVCVRLLNPLLG
ncbi:hypothetical protein EXN66_Car006192 [Channa argus]|uniref:Uncharacterized protein n=1 Tax=Channa argus TaxID=215402 RepID=A0A6G1PJX1_CHAAH|nr:hypothetical protein EXN66_Car006192 [Channa argus]